MDFDWHKAIDRNCEALSDIAFRLLVMAGIQAGRTVSAMPRHLYLRILAVLRPAEYAARRLIAMAACKLVTITMLPTKRRRRRPPNSVILGLDPRTHSGDSEKPSKMENAATSSIIGGGLRLYGVGPRVKPEDDALCETRQAAVDTAPGATAPAFALFDPFKRFGPPWLEPGEIASDEDHDAWPALPPDEPVDAKSLCRRIRALAGALRDLEGQALRLARWRARRHLESSRPKRWWPMRPGRPPGWRKRSRTAIEEVLKECHFLARDAWNTS